jgi:hypothetical protein
MKIEVVERGAARIGRTGTKLHAAYKSRRTDDDGKVTEYWMVRCGCGCSNKRFSIVPGATPNCGNSREAREPKAATLS